MKKIIISLSIIGVVAAVVIGGTIAFFSDTETSTGNTFTAGSIDLKIDSQSHYAGLVCDGGHWVIRANGTTTRPDLIGLDCGGTWAEADLGGHVFYDFADLKPGDQGENTISIHVYDNDAWLRYRSDNIQNFENGCNEAEVKSNDTTCDVGDDQGELGDSLDWHVWLDQGDIPGFQNIDANGILFSNGPRDPKEGDNIQNTPIEFTVLGGDDNDGGSDNLYPFRDGVQYFFAESLMYAYGIGDGTNPCTSPDGHNDYGPCQGLAVDGRIVGSTTYYFGTAWCLGTFDYDTNDPLGVLGSCDGSTVPNTAQGDSFVADSIYEVVQHRNNPNRVF